MGDETVGKKILPGFERAFPPRGRLVSSATTPRRDPGNISLSKRERELQRKLSRAITAAVPWVRKIDDSISEAQSPYKKVAEVLIELRHEIPGPNGQTHDLNGRTALYRSVVRNAYVQAGADPIAPLSKKLTAGSAYWVRKLLMQRYGARKLCEMGIISLQRSVVAAGTGTGQRHNDRSGMKDLEEVVGVLNLLAADPDVRPTEELVLSATRAVNLLRQKLLSEKSQRGVSQFAV